MNELSGRVSLQWASSSDLLAESGRRWVGPIAECRAYLLHTLENLVPWPKEWDYTYKQETVTKIQHVIIMMLDDNPSKDVPYHGEFHVVSMAKRAMQACSYLQIPEYQKWLCILFSVLLHDYDHSGGARNDEINVKRSQMWLDYYADHYLRDMFPDLEMATLKICLSDTQFPYRREPRLPESAIVRDADLSQSMEDNWLEYLVTAGLRFEMMLSMNKYLSIKEMAKGQLDFIGSKIKWNTEWGTKVAGPATQRRVAVIQDAIDFHDGKWPKNAAIPTSGDLCDLILMLSK